MSKITLLHNPRCSKSRQTLALLEQKGVPVAVREYLKQPLNQNELGELLEKLGFASARQLMRQKEELYKALGLNNDALSEAELIEAMAQNPKLMERPVLITADNARIGRPPEQVLEIL